MTPQRRRALLRLAISLLLPLLLFVPSAVGESSLSGRVDSLVHAQRFDFATWEFETLWAKATADLAAGHIYLDEAARKQLVVDFAQAILDLQQINAQLDQIYVNPGVTDPARASAVLQAEAVVARDRVHALQPLAEAILEEQVASVLLEAGFGYLGHAWPPVRMHVTPLPTLLVVSPRDVIRRDYAVTLSNGLPTPERAKIEAAVLDTLNYSGYVTDIGGLGLYPSMIVETAQIRVLLEVTAHEWSHHWLGLYPIGLNYNASGEMRTINETAASVVGSEISAEVLRRYYPELVPPPASQTEAVPPPSDPNQPPPFDFNAEMAATRIQADALLATGDIEAAEAYMEERRRFFWDHGYQLRVLNQAFFAFHGAYADHPGATGADPVGPLVLQIRQQSSGLRAFMDKLRFVTSFDDLEAVAAALAAEQK